MGLGSILGAIGGSIIPGIGTAGGAAIGGALESLFSDDNEDSSQAEYAAYKLQREREWEATFGPIEQNLVSYYEHLNATNYIAQGESVLEQQHKAMLDRVGKDLAARGLDIKGGISTSILKDSLIQLGEAKAKLHTKAEEYVTKQQQNFYAAMSAHRPNAQSAINSAAQANWQQQVYNDKLTAGGTAAIVNIVDKVMGNNQPNKVKPAIGGNKPETTNMLPDGKKLWEF